MNKVRFAVSSSLLLLLAVFFIQPLPAETGEETIEIQVSPQTILLNWKALGNVKLTVHADVNFSLGFDRFDVSLDGVQAAYVYSDDRGDLVAKFNFWDIAALVREQGVETATLTLVAVSEDGTIYVGSDQVRVMDK
jgi:hypothetical protein